MNFLHSHLDYCPDTDGKFCEEQGESFCQEITAMDERYWGQWNVSIAVYY